MRKPLMVLLGLGVIAGYGSALGHMRHRMHGDCGGGGRWAEGRWQDGPYGGSYRWGNGPREQAPVAPVAAPAPVQQQPVMPQIIIVQPQAVAQPAPAAAPTIIVQQPQAVQPAQPIIVQQPAALRAEPAARPASAE